ncbi:Mini-ribonuclease 3 [Leptolyngbyaceae cyanobacterium CCMR0082]|uniref:Mini-ribonuclease 3 n=2 Tax=Adonisia turfae TaxID=2950184 RepID=A0A6M0S8P6_9CYAN|nr:ribonuclease III domain-containing protein [Adonisia turfae]MDV3353695.1 ribonuclease III domain-containing protein [Leptothoe sp. LEGE 181152]NEZ56670.1 Mini-ribonuclease 3 [Adonisia turfae CCMR0081]NEZ64848.1 Mini-ribonuclease 3 [Adonisia turfae CCMR0082]
MDSHDGANDIKVPLPTSSQLTEIFSPGALQFQQVQSVPPIALAYIGDAVFELYVRMQFLWPPQRIQMFHQQVVSQVKAEQQAAYLEQLTPHLRDVEADIVRRGRNATSKAPRRLSAKIYRQSTAFEALVGYLYITDQPRLCELLKNLSVTSTLQ